MCVEARFAAQRLGIVDTEIPESCWNHSDHRACGIALIDGYKMEVVYPYCMCRQV